MKIPLLFLNPPYNLGKWDYEGKSCSWCDDKRFKFKSEQSLASILFFSYFQYIEGMLNVKYNGKIIKLAYRYRLY